MNINTSSDVVSQNSVNITPGYMSGFGNSFETEALPGALPIGRNSPQRCAYGLYAEQLSGSPFTAPRGSNERSWLYRIRPSVKHSGRFAKVDAGLWRSAPCHEVDWAIAQLRWDPAPIPKQEMTFLQGVQTMTTAGDANTQAGMAAHIFLITSDAFSAAALTDPDVARLYEPFLDLLVRGLLAGERATQPPTAT